MWYRRIFRLSKQVIQAVPKLFIRPSKGNGEGHRLNLEALRQLERLQIRGSRALRGDRTGGRISHRRKPASEFIEHRMYVPGDDIRFVDWQATARHEQVFIRQGEMPKDVLVYLLVDTSGSMLWGKPPKRDTQLAVATALGVSALQNGDRLYVVPYGENPNPEFGPASGKGHLTGFTRHLNQLSYGGESHLEAAVQSLTHKVARGGVVFILSDLLERGDLGRVLSSLPAPKWWVNVLHLLHPAEVAPEIRGSWVLEDSETGLAINYDLSNEAIRRYQQRVVDWCEQLEMTAVAHHAFYLMIDTDALLDKEILPLLRERQVLLPL
ncbi:MAG: DUF58 domain-containing protein [Anaerolineales bacterium]|nr:DUF58 domain-containing protein [Anaerolineales bacterium]